MIKVILCRFFFVFTLIAGLFPIAEGQQAGNHHIIRLKSGDITPPGNARAWLDSMSQAHMPEGPVQALIHFNGLPSMAQRSLLSQSGITLLDYIPDNSFMALLQFPLNKALLASLPIHSIINIQPEMKADAYLWKKINAQKGGVEVLVSFYRNVDVNTIRQYIASIGGRTDQGQMENYGYYKVIISAAKIRTLAQWYGVHYISPAVTAVTPLDNESMPAVKANIASSTIYGGYGLTGDGVTVGVGDDASGNYHIDLDGRITNFNPGPSSVHGQLVNGIVGEAAIIDPFAVTMTPHVSLVDHYFDNILPATGAMYNDYNMTITNNSYELIAGDCDYSGTYDGYSEFLDTLSIQYPNVQHVFASGNDGAHDCTPYVSGFGTVGGGYQPAKNIIAVGSMTDYLIEASDESRGPTKDGRLKPEIIAIGLGTYATSPGNKYVWDAGTSMASPQVAGGIAALTQHYKDMNGGAQPRADLLKAILLDGAMDLGNPGPDFSYGYGSMDMYRSLQIMDNNHYLGNSISDGDSQTLTITVPPNTGQLKVMLYWNDAPGSPSAAKELVNDLDLAIADPALSVHLPLVLDATPANVNNNATEGADHTNNSEQVTITNPSPGGYTVKVKGYSVPSGTQPYAVAYDIIPTGMHLTFPLGGEQLPNMTGDSIRIFWDAVSDSSTFTGQFSQDNGVTWTTISDSIPPNIRNCDLQPSVINSGNCLARIINNSTSETITSGRFVLNTQPLIMLDTAQCPGYISIHWPPVPTATSYYLCKKAGLYMQVVDSVTDTAYTFGGMSLNDFSYVAVQPVLSGLPGYRSLAAMVQANTGNCTNPVSDGDLLMQGIVSPGNGRMYTSTQLTSASVIKVAIRDLYRANCNHYVLSYRVNGGLWQQLVNPGAIPANSSSVVTIPGVSFTTPGSYNITVAVTNTDLADPQPSNDTLAFTVLNIPNDTIILDTAFFDGFETMGRFAVSNDSVGVSPNGHWDYFNINDTGRMRSFVDDDITITGNRSISLDERYNVSNGSMNTFVGTFNLIDYDTATTEVRIDFDYILHGNPKTDSGNVVTARGNDTSPWIPVFTYNLTAYPGYVTPVNSLSLTDALRAGKRNFSTSSQVSFGQNDTSLIALVNYGNGITIDNFRLYTVTNDAQLLGIVSPLTTNCGLPASSPLTVQVRNGVQATLYHVQLFYSLDGGATYTGIIDSIPAKQVVDFTFSQPLDIPPGTTHSLNVWLVEAGDSYTANDSLLNYNIRNSVIFNTYPYLENFEAGDGGYFSGGYLDSWQYGTPASPKIHNAASGTKAWKTNLTGNYNDLEKSYLYSPCFDISQMINPMLSFSEALDIENCGNVLCDAAYMEYSFDGVTWTKLGAAGQGYNWYDSTFDVWNPENFTRWHVASINLPEFGGGQKTRFRFVMAADPGVTYEGIAVDDIHIFERNNAIYPASGITTVSNSISGNIWTDFTLDNQLLASLQPNNQTIDNTEVALYAQDTLHNPGSTQYTFPRSYTIEAAQPPGDSVGVRLYLLDSDVVNVLDDTTCPSCTPITDAYRLGITQYDNSGNISLENGTLADDTGGIFTYYPYTSIAWVPYDKGYYAQLTVKPFSEFWFNNGGPTGSFPAGIDYLTFEAYRTGQHATAFWYSLIDTAVNTYSLQRSSDGATFTTIANIASLHANPGIYSYNDTAAVNSSTIIYYRLQWALAGNGSAGYSPIREVNYADSANGLVTMTARMINKEQALVSWGAAIDGIISHYVLERAISNGAYTTIDNAVSAHIPNLQYYYTDQPPGHITTGTPIHYRLTAYLEDGTILYPPIQTINWVNGTSLVKVYPNPTTNGDLTIIWNADAGTVMNVNITDMLGRSMYKTNVTSTQFTNITSLQTSHFVPGVYAIYLDIGGTRYEVSVVYE